MLSARSDNWRCSHQDSGPENGVGGREAGGALGIETVHQLEHLRVLAAHLKRTEATAQAQLAGAVETTTRRDTGAGVGVEAGLQLKGGLQASTEVFGSPQAPTASVQPAARQAHAGTGSRAQITNRDLAGAFADKKVDQAIQRDLRLGMGDPGQGPESGQGDRRLFQKCQF